MPPAQPANPAFQIRLVAVDLDGTLLTSQGAPAPEGCRLLTRAAQQGVRVVLATARGAFYTRPFCRQLGISDPIINSNGAQIWATPEGPLWASHTIPRPAALVITREADLHGWDLSTTVGEMTFWHVREGQAPGQLSENRTLVETNTAALSGEPVRIIVHQPEAIACLLDLCLTRLARACRTELYVAPDGHAESLGIFPFAADKGTALRFVLDRLGIHPDQVMAIGDNNSDLPMFYTARVRVAMGNAPANVKERATAIAPTNDAEGVAWALQQFLFNEVSS
jgi:Cof subfamily protein (haloacid dehalogenase superfamily)